LQLKNRGTQKSGRHFATLTGWWEAKTPPLDRAIGVIQLLRDLLNRTKYIFVFIELIKNPVSIPVQTSFSLIENNFVWRAIFRH
jgi:hypothetical protein